MALQVFEEYLKRANKKYVVSDSVSIADFALVYSAKKKGNIMRKSFRII
jgi:glutathione S-transferase